MTASLNLHTVKQAIGSLHVYVLGFSKVDWKEEGGGGSGGWGAEGDKEIVSLIDT